MGVFFMGLGRTSVSAETIGTILSPCLRCLFENIRTELAGLGGRNSPHTPLPPASP